MDGVLMENNKEPAGYLYTVLNLTKDATQAEINDRHRSLSLIFHPDKQTDEQLKTAATKEFLEVQRAYQVLSDSFLRQVYDALGSEGLKIKWPTSARSRSREEVQEMLVQMAFTLTRRKQREAISPRGRVTWSFNAAPLFDELSKTTSFASAWSGLQNTHVLAKSLAYSAEKRLNVATSICFEGRSHMQGPRGSVQFLGTIRHQFSPRLVAVTNTNFSRPYFTNFDVNYDDGNNCVEFKTALSPLMIFKHLPTTAVSYSRRLFHDKPQRGKVALRLSQQPSISFFYVSPATIEIDAEDAPSFQSSPPTASGLKYIAYDRNFGIVFETIVPKLVAEASVHLVELSTRLKGTIEYGFTGALATLGVYWNNDTMEASTSLILAASGLVIDFHLSYLENQISLPIVLSTGFSPRFALGAIVLPSTAISLGYHLLILPRRRARRLAYIRAAKRSFEEDSDARKQRAAVESLLTDAVKKQVRIETEKEGLVIQEAIYGATDMDDGADSVLLNVTVPLQALVRHSQLHIPGGDTKAALQGFSDPAPFAPKTLRIRYLFRGRVHYAEIPDYLAVVLPLADHQVHDSSSR